MKKTGNTVRTLPYIVLLMLGLSLAAFGQGDTKFTATVSKNKVGVNDHFQVRFIVENGSPKQFQPPEFKDFFYIITGPNQSSQTTIVNGQVSQTYTFSYYLQPRSEGTFTIGPAKTVVNGKTYTTDEITITVGGGGKGSAQSNSGGQQQSSPQQDNQPKTVDEQLRENIYIRAFVDKTEVYQGEQITVTFKLYTRAQLMNTHISDPPDYTGFWTQEIAMPNQINYSPEMVNGERYNTAVIKKMALFPQRSGELEIDPLHMKTFVRVKVGDDGFWGGFFSRYEERAYEFKSSPIKIKVKPFPAKGKPDNFSGVAGDLDFDVSLDKTEAKLDDAITLKMTVEGQGNIRMVEMPEPDIPGDFEVFDPKVSENLSKKSNTVSGSVTHDYLLIPRRPGTFKVPPISFAYFDTDKEEYVTLTSKEYSITVKGEGGTTAGSNGYTPSSVDKEDLEMLGEDIRYIHTSSPNFSKKGNSFYGSPAAWALFAAPWLLFALVFVVRKRQQALAGDTVLMKQRRATKQANKRLAEAAKHMKGGDNKAFYDATTRAIWGYLGDKLLLEPAQLSRDVVEEQLSRRGIQVTTISQLFELLDDCEMALFAPGAGSDMETTYAKTEELLSQIETDLK